MKKIVSIFVCLLCSWGCTSSHSPKPKILVTIAPYASLVKNLIGDSVDVEIVVSPGSNPHTYEPSPVQINHFTQARVWFRTGDPAENKMVHFLNQYQVKIVNLSQGQALLTESSHSHDHGDEIDLHLWLDPMIVVQQVDRIATVLIQQFPELAPLIQENKQQLEVQLQKLDIHISSELAPFQGRYLLVSHPALGYYCQRYNLHQISVEIEGKDPLPQDIAHLMYELQHHPVPVVLIEPQYNRKGAILIADKLHIPYEEINPYAENYFEILNHLTEVIVKYYGHPSS
jgi:zinc transport system substrate-binding protein